MQKAFTLLELLVVVIIIGVIVWAVWRLFSYKDADRLNFDTCYITVYWKIDKFFQEAISQQGAYTGGVYKTPDFYNIIFDKTNQQINLVFSGYTTGTIVFHWEGEDTINKCYSPTYHTYFSGDISKIQIKAGLQVDTSTTEHSPMELYEGNSLLPAYKTGVIYFYYCDHPSNVDCLQKYKIEVDPRAYLFKSYFCKTLNSDWTCKVWSE